MTEYLSKKAVLEWLDDRRYKSPWIESFRDRLESGAFDADTSEIQRLRALLERLDSYIDFSEYLSPGDWEIEDVTGINSLFDDVREALSTTTEPAETQRVTRTWSHHCPNINDNHGPQVVEYGDSCPFCGVNSPEGD